jgi:hypothetical protein
MPSVADPLADGQPACGPASQLATCAAHQDRSLPHLADDLFRGVALTCPQELVQSEGETAAWPGRRDNAGCQASALGLTCRRWHRRTVIRTAKGEPREERRAERRPMPSLGRNLCPGRRCRAPTPRSRPRYASDSALSAKICFKLVVGRGPRGPIPCGGPGTPGQDMVPTPARLWVKQQLL